MASNLDSGVGKYIYQGTECALGVCNSMISYCAGELGCKFFSHYYNVGPSNVIMLGVDLYRDPEHAAGTLAGFGASWAASAWAGAKIGAACGGVVGAVAGAIVGFFVGTVVSYCVNELTDSYRSCSGIFSWRSPGGSGGPGGVEFRKIKPMSGFTEAEIVLSRNCNIFFETDNEKLAREAFNSICLPNFRNRTMKEYYETIMAEIFQITLNGGDLPFVSLHFNNNGILYSVMNPLYKQTIIGNTLTFLDYFLKGFVNGGFFKIDFIQKWKLNPIVDLDKLNQNLIDVRKELKKVHSGYQSLYSLLDENYYGNEFTSAFRIIGEISEICQMSGQTILPDSGFLVESDLFPSASFQNIMNRDKKAQEKWIKITTAHNKMKYIVQQLMPLVPQFTGYFEILKMICFALHYSESLDSVGLKAETNLAFQNQKKSYVEIIPETFPPLPVRKTIKLDPKITYGEALNTLSFTPFDQVLHQIMDEKLSDFTEDSLYDMEDKINQMYKERINIQAAKQGLPPLDDDDIELENFVLTSMSIIHSLKFVFIKILSLLYVSFINALNKVLCIEEDEIKRNLSKTELEYFDANEDESTIPQLRMQCGKIIEMITKNGIEQFTNKLITDSFGQDEIRAANESIDRQRTAKINNLNREIEKGRNILNTLNERINDINNLEAQYNALDFESRNLPGNIATMNDARQKKAQLEEGIRDINNQMRNMELDKNRTNTEANSMKAQNNENRIKRRDELRQEIKENIPLLLEKYDEFNNYYHHPSQIDQTKFPFFQKIVDCAISISTPVIVNGQNSTSIRGGCLIRSQKSCNIINQELSIEDEQNIDECVRNGKDFIALHDKKGFLVNFKLQSHKYSLVPFSESNESSCIKEFIQKYGFTMEHLELFSGIVNSSLSRMTLNQLNSKTLNNVSGASLACCNGSINSIDLFIKKGQDFGEVQYNGTYPFLEVMANEKHDAALYILSKNAKISDINRSTETGVTPLHWAVYYGWNDVTSQLISRGASTKVTLRSNGMTPIHLACFHDQPQCLSILMKANDCTFEKSLSGLTPFHVASAHSLSCALLLIKNGKADINTLDSNNHTARDIAILNGQYEIAKNISEFSQTIHFEIQCTGLNASSDILDLKSLCKAFSSGDVKMAERILSKMAKLKTNLKPSDEKMLIECACAGRCTEFVELLSTIIQLEKHHIVVDAAHYGIVNWLKELKKYGADFTVNDYCFFDEAILNGDDNFLAKALDIVDNIPETVWRRIINIAVKINDERIILVLAKCLHFNEKYTNIHLQAKDVITPKTKEIVFIQFVKFILPDSLEKLSEYIDSMSINFLQFLLKYKKFNNSEIQKAILASFKNNHLDATYIMLNEYPLIFSNLCTKMPGLRKLSNQNYTKAKDKIQNLIKQKIRDNAKINELKQIYQSTFNIGLLHIFNNCSLLDLTEISFSFFWILKCLPNEIISQFCFYSNFGFNDNFIIIFTMIFDIFEKAFKNRAGSLFLNSLRNLDFDELDEQYYGDNFISALLDIMMKYNRVQYIKSVDDENQTMFHIAAKFRNISNSTLDTLVEKIQIATRSWKDLLNVRSRKGKTILMIFASKGNFEAIKMLDKMNVNIETRDIYGNNILHEILQDKTMTNDKVIDGIINIVNKHRELIIQRNRKGKNAFYLAAKRGFNGVLGVFSMFYPASFLDNLDENCIKSAVHVAAKENYHETVRYLVQTLHLNLHIKTNNHLGQMPIHLAAKNSSLSAFKEIIKLGGNPLAEDSTGKNALYYALAYGTHFIVSQIAKMPSFLYEISSPKVLIPIVQNPEAASLFSSIIHLIDPSATRSCDERGMTLLSIAAEHNNRQIVDQLLILGIDPTKPANNGRNSIHICAANNVIGCSTLIIKFLLLTKGSDIVNQVLNSPDDRGDLPIHIAARKGFSGFVSHLLSSSSEIDLQKVNHEGHNPISLAQKHGHKDVAVIIENYYLCHEYKLENDQIDNISRNSEVSKDISNIWKLNKEIENISKEEYQIKKIDPRRTDIQGTIINTFTTEMEKFKINIEDNLLGKYFQVFNNGFFVTKLVKLATNKEVNLVNRILEQMNKNKPTMINLISYIIIFPQLPENEIKDFIVYIDNLNKINVKETHPIFHWIVNGLISAIELKEPNQSVIPFIKSIVDFASRVYTKSSLRRTIKYPCLPLPIHIIIPWLMSLTDTWLQVQLQFIDKMKITVLFEKEPKLSIDFCNRLDYEQFNLVNFIMDQKNQVKYLDHSIDFKEYVIHSIQSTNELYEDSDLQDDVRNMLMNKCLTLSKKEIFTAKSLTKWASLTRRIIDDFGLKYLIDILAVIPQQSLEIANYALSLIINIGSPEDAPPSLIKRGIKSLEKKSNEIERGKYVENRSLDKILNAFKKQNKEFIPYKFAFDGIPIVELNQNDRNKLGQFGKILESKVQITGSLQEAAQTAGKKFRDNPNIENAAQLVGIIRFAIQDTLNLKPFMIQCLAVGALLLHRINHSEGLKGRIAQIATGEGKSIIVAMLSASIALTGSFVDVISSSFYLAERDAEKFEPFYEKLGLKCGTLNEHDSSPYVDFHIIYSTNTGFEFAFLREGISGKSTLLATPLYKNTLVKRIPMTAIVDEADNLFIDTVTNSARIAVGSSSQRTWIFKPFFKAVIENKITNKLQARHFLLSIAQTQSEKDSLEDISDHQLDRWIENAIYANNSLKKDVDYVVGFNKDIQQYEIQIVDQQNTGRINIGCRWSGGLHEFVEVKENLQVQPQSLTIASVSHPSFFGRYQEIYGLTGTMGEEVERNEIRSIYKVDTFDVPPNRVCLRKRDDTLIVSTEDEKHELIIEQIKKITKQRRPILVIVLTISESQQLSEKLRARNIKHFVLNDVQVEDEDFIIDRAGKCGAVTIATNTAGRGTDIKLEKMAIDCGGLHVIISFFPVNLRVECQGLGRAGRQGQPGSCQIIYSSDTFAGNVPKASEDILRIIYEDRTESVRGYSSKRLTYVQKENLLFNVLISYFNYVKQMRAFLESPQGEQIIRFNGGENLGNHYDSESILNDLSLEWSKFYTSISNGEVELKENLFDCFKSKYEEKMIILTDVFNEYIQGNDYLTTNSGSIDTPSPSNSLDINRKYDKTIIGFTGSKPPTK